MNKFSSRKGFTLIEITLVLGLTLGLAAALIFGLAAFQRGSDRAKCLMNISNVQKAVRSWANFNEIAPGTTVNAGLFPAGNGAAYGRLWGKPASFLGSRPMCPRNTAVLSQSAATRVQTGAPIGYNHAYNRGAGGAGGLTMHTVPEVGFPYINCSLAGFQVGATAPAGETFHQPCEIDGVATGGGGVGAVPRCNK